MLSRWICAFLVKEQDNYQPERKVLPARRGRFSLCVPQLSCSCATVKPSHGTVFCELLEIFLFIYDSSVTRTVVQTGVTYLAYGFF